jgi:hypothetical protein
MNKMMISATYICPIRGLAGLEPPDPARMGQAARVGKSIGLERLFVPVLEEALAGPTKAKVRYLEGLISSLDQTAESGTTAQLIAPAQRVLGLDFVPPHLVRGVPDPKAGPVFVDGKIRNLRAFDWWKDPSYVQKRMRIFHELMDAVTGHPALTGWLVLDRAMEWVRPDPETADLVLRSYSAEIREHDEGGAITLGLGWPELLHPQMAQALSQQVDGLRMSGLEQKVGGLAGPKDSAEELFLTAYLGTLAQWLFEKPVEIEIGWGALHQPFDIEEIIERSRCLAAQGLAGVNALSLIDPEPKLRDTPPWVLRSGLDHIGLLDRHLEPKEHVEGWLGALHSSEPRRKIEDFIDVSRDEYFKNPNMHLFRLWEHFKESCGYHPAQRREKGTMFSF